MIAFANPDSDSSDEFATVAQHTDWHASFLRMLPLIRAQARFGFRHLRPEARAEAVQEVIANAFVAYRRLVELGHEDLAYATPLARYAIAQVREGRQVGNRLNVHDITSVYCQRRTGIRMEHLERYDVRRRSWVEIVVEDRTATPAEIAILRIDFRRWLAILPRRHRRIAQKLAIGETTTTVARQYGVSAARISQVRRELQEAWREFQGEVAEEKNAGSFSTVASSWGPRKAAYC